MFVPFESISSSSRVWIYQADRKFSGQDITIITEQLKLFTEEWAAHGNPLKASFEVRYDHFILLAADEGYNAASGCSIDSSVHVIKEIERHLNVSLFDRNKVAFKKDDGVELIAIQDLKRKFLEGVWNERTLVFNNIINNKGQLDNEWLAPAGTTWVKRYVPNETLAN